MTTRFISYGKKVENLTITIENKVLGSAFTTFESKVQLSDSILFVCNSKIWGSATVSSKVFHDNSVLWKDKPYPFRAEIENIKIFKNPFNLDKYNLNDDFRSVFGKGWAFKVLFTPGDIPQTISKKLLEITLDQVCIKESEQVSFLQREADSASKARRKKLGLS